MQVFIWFKKNTSGIAIYNRKENHKLEIFIPKGYGQYGRARFISKDSTGSQNISCT